MGADPDCKSTKKSRHSSNALPQEKPASQEADLRSITCLLALRALRGVQFSGIGACWLGCLMQMTGLFEDLLSGDFFVSLGFQHAAVLAWKVEQVEKDLFVLCSHVPSSLAESREQLQFHRLRVLPEIDQTAQEEYQGIPYEVCEPSILQHLFYFLANE